MCVNTSHVIVHHGSHINFPYYVVGVNTSHVIVHHQLKDIL